MDFCICNNENDQTASISCDGCEKWFHRRCLAIPWKDFRELRDDANSNWICPSCSNNRIPLQTTHSSQAQPENSQPENSLADKSSEITSLPIKCPLCPRTFKNNTGLSHHTRHHHGEEYRRQITQRNQHNKTDDQEKPEDKDDELGNINKVFARLTVTLNNLYNSDSLDQTEVMECFSIFCETMKNAAKVLPGPKHPAIKFYEMRKRKYLFKQNDKTFEHSSNPQRSSKRARQRRNEKYNYELLQYEFYNKRKSCVKKIMKTCDDVLCNINMKTLEESFSSRWSPENTRIRSDYGETIDFIEQTELDITFSNLITNEEVECHLKRMDSQSSPGHDGISVRALKSTQCSCCLAWLFSIFNKWSFLPKSLKEARTTLIYKKGDKNDPSNWRPISVCSTLRRLYERIILSKMRKYTKVSEFQTGSQNIPGTFVNSSIINGCLNIAKEEQRDITVVFLDIAKAFDSIGHAHIYHTINHLPYPQHLRDIILNLTFGNFSRIKNNNSLSTPIYFNQGIFQGSVISPEIFNLCIDFILKSLTEKEVSQKYGFNIDKDLSPISALGFVDDTAIIGKIMKQHAN